MCRPWDGSAGGRQGDVPGRSRRLGLVPAPPAATASVFLVYQPSFSIPSDADFPASGYRLTAMGRELHETFLPLHRFAERWSKLRAN
jgi:hypothetical protein